MKNDFKSFNFVLFLLCLFVGIVLACVSGIDVKMKQLSLFGKFCIGFDLGFNVFIFLCFWNIVPIPVFENLGNKQDGEEVIYNFKDAENIVISANCLMIRTYQFQNNDKIRTVRFQNSSTRIADRSFCNCKNLEYISLPINLSKIPPFVFAFCIKLKKITIPRNVEEIGEGAFVGCTSFNELDFCCDEDELTKEIKDNLVNCANWGLSDSCKIKFQDWKNPKTIKDFLKELGEKEKTEQTAAQSDS